MRRGSTKRPATNIAKLYRQAWAMFNRDLITKEEFVKRLEYIKSI